MNFLGCVNGNIQKLILRTSIALHSEIFDICIISFGISLLSHLGKWIPRNNILSGTNCKYSQWFRLMENPLRFALPNWSTNVFTWNRERWKVNKRITYIQPKLFIVGIHGIPTNQKSWHDHFSHYIRMQWACLVLLPVFDVSPHLVISRVFLLIKVSKEQRAHSHITPSCIKTTQFELVDPITQILYLGM